MCIRDSAVPINLSPCLNAINQCPEAQLVNFHFRDVEYGSRAQTEFLQAGGLILSLSGSSLASDGSEAVSYTHLDVYKRQALCDAVGGLHAGFAMAGETSAPVIHRDLKPSNIIVTGANYTPCLLYTSRCV